MIVINKNETKKFYFRLNPTIDPVYYLFSIRDNTLGTYSYFMSDDISEDSSEYNVFYLREGGTNSYDGGFDVNAGSFDLKIYQTSTQSLNPDLADEILEVNLLQVVGDYAGAFTPTDYQYYNQYEGIVISPNGTSGTSGTSGVGTSGTSGTSGSSGTSGAAGTSGTSGSSGGISGSGDVGYISKFDSIDSLLNSNIYELESKIGIGTTEPTALLDINSDVLRLRTPKTPSLSDDTGNQGDICWDEEFLYICVSENSWRRAALEAW